MKWKQVGQRVLRGPGKYPLPSDPPTSVICSNLSQTCFLKLSFEAFAASQTPTYCQLRGLICCGLCWDIYKSARFDSDLISILNDEHAFLWIPESKWFQEMQRIKNILQYYYILNKQSVELCSSNFPKQWIKPRLFLKPAFRMI